MPDIYKCEIIGNEKLADVKVAGAGFLAHAITARCGDLARKVLPGQFIHVKCGEGLILRRPFGVCCVRGDTLKFVFEVKGAGTKFLAGRGAGEPLDILGPLGNGFEIPGGRVVVVGGGLGAPPMLFAAEMAPGRATAVLGFRDACRVFLVNEFEAVCDKVYLATDDGSAGVYGLVTKPLEVLLARGGFNAVLTCGQLAMQRSVAELCTRYGVKCQVLLEERLGCGVGACLVCACATKKDGVMKMSRVCRDGPVFDAGEVFWRA